MLSAIQLKLRYKKPLFKQIALASLQILLPYYHATSYFIFFIILLYSHICQLYLEIESILTRAVLSLIVQ